MFLSAIFAVDRNWCIGRGGQVPWHCHQDFLYFRCQTLGKVCLVGRRTYESLPFLKGTAEHGLRGRHMVVVSTTLEKDQGPHTTVAATLEEALSMVVPSLLANGQGWHPEVMVIGGNQLYRQVQDKVDRLYITYLEDVETEDGDTYLPQPDSQWSLASSRTERSDLYGLILFGLYLRRGSPGTV